MNKTPIWDGKRWRIQEQKDGKRYSFSCSTPGTKGRKECQRKYESWLYGESSGGKTVERVAYEYLQDIKSRNGEHSGAYDQNECYIRLYIVPRCGQKKICKMTLRDWQNVINEARGQKKALSEKTLKNLRGMIMGIVKFGYEDYQCEMLRGKLYIPKGHSKQEKEILQKEDVRRLFEESDLWYHPVFLLGVLCGLRPGEILGLQLSDISEDFSRLTIHRAVNARGYVTPGKNSNAKRVIPLGKMASDIIKKAIKRNEDFNLRTEWIFCSPDGSQGNQHTMRNQWRRLKAERDLPGTVYSLRHTFVSLLKSELPESALKSVLGHSASFETIGTYGHYIEGEEKQIASVIDLTFGKIQKAK